MCSRALELNYAARLKVDLQKDIYRFGNFEAVELAAKTLPLKELAKEGGTATSFDQSILSAQALFYSTYVALPVSQSSTFNELKSTGNFRFMHNPAIRTAIAFFDWQANDVELPDTDIDEGLSELRSHPDFRAAVNSERHYTAALIYWLREIRWRGESLLNKLDEEYPTGSQ